MSSVGEKPDRPAEAVGKSLTRWPFALQANHLRERWQRGSVKNGSKKKENPGIMCFTAHPWVWRLDTLDIRVERPMLGVAVLHLTGKWHAAKAGRLRRSLEQLLSDSTPLVVVDMGEVSFIDSTVLSVLVSGLRMAREKEGTLVLARVEGQAREALRLTLLDRVFRLYPSVEEALQALAQGLQSSG